MKLNSGIWIAWLICWIIAARFVQPTKVSESLVFRLIYVVPLYLGAALIFNGRSSWIYGRFYESRPIEYAGTILTLLGLLFSVWARFHLGRYWSGFVALKEGHKLIRTGPYRFARHPIYTGMLLGMAGSAMTAGTGDALIGLALFLVAILLKIHKEEALLTRQFGDEYFRFKREVATLVPFVC